MDIPEENKKRLFKGLFVLLCILCAYFGVKALSEIKQYTLLGDSGIPATISFTGHGEVTAVPDIATIYFTISKDAKTPKEAEDAVAELEKKVLDFLKKSNIADKDIKAENISVYPKYDDVKIMMPCTPYECPPRRADVGDTARESITIKVRNTDDAGKIIQGLTNLGVREISGPNFTIDNEDNLKAEARKKAIDEAEMKAKLLAKDLGVSLGKISGFSENGNYPMYYGLKDTSMGRGGGDEPAPAQLPKGENTISSDVTITYEIKQ